MANIANPRKQFQFSITAPGLNPFLAQKVTIPGFDIDVVEHGDTNFKVKTGGIHNFGKITIEKISTALGPDNWLANWMSEVQNVILGGGLLPSIYKRTITIEQFSNDGLTIINRWICYGCWPSKRDGISLDRTSSENTMESIELETDQVVQQ
jgi:phage tail-like protein